MPRSKRKTLNDVLVELSNAEAKVKELERTARMMRGQCEYQPGDKVQFTRKGETLSGVVGTRRGDYLADNVEYFIYVDRADGFGADGHVVPWYDVMFNEPEVSE